MKKSVGFLIKRHLFFLTCLSLVSEILLCLGVALFDPVIHQEYPFPIQRAPASTRPFSGSIGGHSHNDYLQKRPLFDALDSGLPSVEADLWLRDGEILVSHHGLSFYGSLKNLYLEPLKNKIAQRASVYGDGRPFYLWLELKETDDHIGPALQALLEHYSFLTVFSDAQIQQKAVTVILTGNRSSKNDYVTRFARRFACRDAHTYELDDAPVDSKWRWYSLHWQDFFTWDGEGPMPRPEEQLLNWLADDIHRKGRQFRFWGAPDTESVWAQALNAGVDLIDTDSPSPFARWLALTGKLSDHLKRP
ncbi:hypothetical protein WDW37_14925 [Bdellovibrionota bacterium FG-1]